MMPSPELGAAAVQWGQKEAVQRYSLCPSLNSVSGGTQISKCRDLLGTLEFISQPGLQLDSRESRPTTPVVSKLNCA